MVDAWNVFVLLRAVILVNSANSLNVRIRLFDLKLLESEVKLRGNPLSTKFQNNTLIEKFNEFDKFTGFKYMGTEGVFENCTKLREIELPATLLGTNTTSTNVHDSTFYKTALVSIDMKNVIRSAQNTFYACPNLIEVKAKNLKYCSSLLNHASKVGRLILPNIINQSATFTGANLAYGVHAMTMIDLGPNMTYLREYVRYKSNNDISGPSFKNTTVILRSRNFTLFGKVTFQGCWRCYVHEEMLSYMKDTAHNSYTNNATYLIGGDEWVAQYGSADEYANLTQEEYDYYYKDMVEEQG